jgi:hypothetical protein
MESEDGPELAAEAIQRGPRTVAMLKNKTSQKLSSLRSWDLTSAPVEVDKVKIPRRSKEDNRNRVLAVNQAGKR